MIASIFPMGESMRKVRTPLGRVQANGLAEKSDGKCHRDESLYRKMQGVKRGKPHLVQDQVSPP